MRTAMTALLLLTLVACKPAGDASYEVRAADGGGPELRLGKNVFGKSLSVSRLGRELSIHVSPSLASRLLIESVVEAGYPGASGETSNLGTQIFKTDTGFRASFRPAELSGATARAWIAFDGERVLCTLAIEGATVRDTCQLSQAFYCKNREALSIQSLALFDCEAGAARRGMTQEQQRALDEKTAACKQLIDARRAATPMIPAEQRADGCVCGRSTLSFYEGDVAWLKKTCETAFELADKAYARNLELCAANVASGKTELREPKCLCKATGNEFVLYSTVSISTGCGLDEGASPQPITASEPQQVTRDYREFVAICQELAPSLTVAGVDTTEDCICGDTQYAYERDFLAKGLTSVDFRRLCAARHDYMASVKPICAELGGLIEDVAHIGWRCRCGSETVSTESLTTPEQFRAACQSAAAAPGSSADQPPH